MFQTKDIPWRGTQHHIGSDDSGWLLHDRGGTFNSFLLMRPRLVTAEEVGPGRMPDDGSTTVALPGNPRPFRSEERLHARHSRSALAAPYARHGRCKPWALITECPIGWGVGSRKHNPCPTRCY